MIDVSNLSEIFAHLEAHPAMSIYGTCPCGTEINSYTGWIQHAVMPVVTDAVMAGFTAGLNYEEPQQIPTDADLDDMLIDNPVTQFDLMAADILDADVIE